MVVAPPNNTTRLLVHVLPCASRFDFLLAPSTRTQCVFPTSSALTASASSLCAAMISASRRRFVSSGTSSTSLRAAAVFSRIEYANMKACSYLISRINATVSACSSSVSPQNPAMKSLDSATPGISSRARLANATYASRVYPRRMRSNTDVEPLCAGTCSCFATLGRSAMTRNTSSGKSFGCGDVNRTRISGFTSAAASRSSANRTAPSRRGLYTLRNPSA